MVRVDTKFDSLLQFSVISNKQRKNKNKEKVLNPEASCTLEGASVTAAQPDDPYLCYLDWCD